MKARIVIPLAIIFLCSLFAVPAVTAAPAHVHKVAVDGTPWVAKSRLPDQPSPREAQQAVAASETTQAKCIGETETLVLALASNDPAHPGVQNVVFFRETPSAATGMARVWVAWDFLATDWGPPDEITCEQIAALQGASDGIVATDVKYFGTYQQRPAGNSKIDIMVYNVVDESYYDPDFGSYIAGYFSAGLQTDFDRNIFILDSYDWAGGLGPDAEEPYMIEGTFAHELEHLIMNDHDNELSWIDEGLAELAVFLNGFGHTGNTTWYLAFHRDSLTMWGSQLEDYGGAYLFQLYLLENFGHKTGGVWDPAWTRAMVDQPLDGIAGVEAQTGEDMATLFDAWMMATLQDDPSRTAAGGYPMGFDEIDTNPYVDPFYGPWSIRRGIKEIYEADSNGNLPVSRYGGNSAEFPLSTAAPYSPIYKSYGGMTPGMSVRFRGDAISGVAPVEGTKLAFSGGGAMLTDRTLALSAPVGGTLTFKTWFDIEEEWDYGFVEVSTNGGPWTAIPGTITKQSTNPNLSTAWKNALGSATQTDAAITGSSNGWVDASFTVPANSKVRINYYTDEAVNGRGWFIDDVKVNGFADGFESGPANWSLGGWVISTGLFANDWIGAYVNPIRQSGKPLSTEIGYVDGTVGTDGYERFNQSLDTSRLGNGEVIFAFANRAAFDDAFDAGYLILAKKKG